MRPRATVRRGKANWDVLVVLFLWPERPALARVAVGTGAGLGLPLNPQMTDRDPLTRLSLPTAAARHRSQ